MSSINRSASCAASNAGLVATASSAKALPAGRTTARPIQLSFTRAEASLLMKALRVFRLQMLPV